MYWSLIKFKDYLNGEHNTLTLGELNAEFFFNLHLQTGEDVLIATYGTEHGAKKGRVFVFVFIFAPEAHRQLLDSMSHPESPEDVQRGC